MMVSLVKGVERRLSLEEGIFLNSAKDLLSKEKIIFRKLRAPSYRRPGSTRSALFGIAARA
jgi:hypothetical protein